MVTIHAAADFPVVQFLPLNSEQSVTAEWSRVAQGTNPLFNQISVDLLSVV